VSISMPMTQLRSTRFNGPPNNGRFLFESNRLRPYSTRWIRQYADAAGIEKTPRSIYFTGHSLGGALATDFTSAVLYRQARSDCERELAPRNNRNGWHTRISVSYQKWIGKRRQARSGPSLITIAIEVTCFSRSANELRLQAISKQ
jgi:hypothetical protein